MTIESRKFSNVDTIQALLLRSDSVIVKARFEEGDQFVEIDVGDREPTVNSRQNLRRRTECHH